MEFHRRLIHLLLIICCVIIESTSYRILAVLPSNSKSHNNMFDPILKGLAKRGHKVDVITHFEMENPPENYRTIINLKGYLPELKNNVTVAFALQVRKDPVIGVATTYGNDICDLMALEKMQKFIKNPPHRYDLFISEAFSTPCYYGIAYILKVPIVTISTLLEFSWISDSVGNPGCTAFAPTVLMKRARISTFFDRLENTFLYHVSKYRFHKMTEDAQTKAMRKYISPDLPNVREVERSVALMFTNYHHSIYGAKPLTPAVIPIGGIHAEQNDDELTPELKIWLDQSTHGVVYFTFGSMILIETLPKETLFIFYKALSKIAPVQVLMKVVDKEKLPPGLPKNVRTSSWIPQVPVLKHKNTKLFITHGGLMGSQEAVYYGVPMIGIPFFSDQMPNMEIFVRKNMAISFEYNSITEEKLSQALNSVLTDPKYKEAAKRESALFRDRPMSIMDTTNFWIEYIIRNGANSLRSPALDLYWWQVELLDVYAFLLFSCIAIICLIVLCVKIIVKVLFKSLTNSKNSKKND